MADKQWAKDKVFFFNFFFLLTSSWPCQPAVSMFLAYIPSDTFGIAAQITSQRPCAGVKRPVDVPGIAAFHLMGSTAAKRASCEGKPVFVTFFVFVLSAGIFFLLFDGRALADNTSVFFCA